MQKKNGEVTFLRDFTFLCLLVKFALYASSEQLA